MGTISCTVVPERMRVVAHRGPVPGWMVQTGESAVFPIIDDHLDAIRALAREFGVARLGVFGSVCTPAFDPERSDIDFLVEYPDGYDYGLWGSRLLELEDRLTGLLGRSVDLVMPKALRNRWFAREAAKTRRVRYDASQVAATA
jgi:uncharacterized protein